LHGGSAESIILVVALVKELIDTVNTNGKIVGIVGDVAILVVLVHIIVVALRKGLVVAIMLP
jgi:hypothetical protein